MTTTIYFKVGTISCQACANAITKAVTSYGSGVAVRVDVPKKLVAVSGPAMLISEEKVKATLEGIGHLATKPTECTCVVGGKCTCGAGCKCASTSSAGPCCGKEGCKPCKAKAAGKCTCGDSCCCGDNCNCDSCPGHADKWTRVKATLMEERVHYVVLALAVGVGIGCAISQAMNKQNTK